MKLKKHPDFPEIGELISILEGKFPAYKIISRGRNEVLVAGSGEYGILITIGKQHIHVEIELITFYAKIIYYLSFLIFGLIISLGIFYSVFYGKVRRMRKEVVGFIKTLPTNGKS